MTTGDMIQLAGIVCIVAGVTGGGVKFWNNGVGIDRFDGVGRGALLAGFGVLLVTFGPGYLEDHSRFRVTSVTAAWDQSQGDGCGNDLPYTVVIKTAGGSGLVKHRLVLGDKKLDAEPLKVNGSGTHSVSGNVHFGYTSDDPPRAPSVIRVETLEPNESTSNSSSMTLSCEQSATEITPSIDQFFRSYYDAVHKYGRSSSATTHDFFDYPLRWYGRTFASEEDFVCYVEQCHQKPRPEPK